MLLIVNDIFLLLAHVYCPRILYLADTVPVVMERRFFEVHLQVESVGWIYYFLIHCNAFKRHRKAVVTGRCNTRQALLAPLDDRQQRPSLPNQCTNAEGLKKF
jgi:hypothetical protein